MDAVFFPDDREWISPKFSMSLRIKQMHEDRANFLGVVDEIHSQVDEYAREHPELFVEDEGPVLTPEEREAIFGKKKPVKKKRGRGRGQGQSGGRGGHGQVKGKGRGRGRARGEDSDDDENDPDYKGASTRGGRRGRGRGGRPKKSTVPEVEKAEGGDDEQDRDSEFEADLDAFFNDPVPENEIPSDPEDFIDMKDFDEDCFGPLLKEKQEEDELKEMEESDGEDRNTSSSDEEPVGGYGSDDDLSVGASFKKEMEEKLPNSAAMAEKDDKSFALHYNYCLRRAKTLDIRAKEKEKWGHKLYNGWEDEKYENMWQISSPHLATTKGEVIVDDPILVNTEMPLLAGAIPALSVSKLTCLALYTTLSDEPGNFQWKMVNAGDQLTSDLKVSHQTMRFRELGPLGPADKVSCSRKETIFTVTMYQKNYLPQGSDFFNLKPTQEPKLGLVIEILGSQNLEDLTKKLFCQSDFMVLNPVDRTEDYPNSDYLLNKFNKLEENNVAVLAKEAYPSKAFCIGDTLYSDDGEDSKKYLEIVNKWVKQEPKKEIGELKFGLLETPLKNVDIRFGYPYLYIHQGNCEHIVVFNSARAPRRVEYSEFPRLVQTGKFKTKYCRVDNVHIARWSVVDYDRVPDNPMLLCTECVNNYCFLGRERVGEFKLFPFLQVGHFCY